MIRAMTISISLLGMLASLPLGCYAQNWTTLASLPTDTLREDGVVALSSDTIATVGGVVSGYSTTDALQFYSISNNSWWKGTPVPLPVNHPNAAAAGGKIYLLGGFTTAGPGGSWQAFNKTFAYDPRNSSWQPLEVLPGPLRGAASVGVYKNTIYVAGGKGGSGQSSVTTVSAFDLGSQKWITLPDSAANMPSSRDHGSAAIVGSKFYYLGGRDTAIDNVKDDVFILDLENLAAGWITSKAKMPTARGGLCAAAVGTKIYTFGGEGNKATGSKGVFNQTEAYDTVTDSWASLGSMKTPRHGTQAVSIDGRIYIPGGATGSGTGDTNMLEAFSP